jgi:Protein of unknown function (DUF2752)
MLRVPFGNRVPKHKDSRPAGLSRRWRIVAALAGVGLLSLLVLASRLQPDARGFGTHEQLGLPSCTFFALFGKRCPACGMTTSWSYAARGQLSDALRAHVGGTLLAGAALLVTLWALSIAASGKRLAIEPRESMIVGLALAATALVLVEWLVRLYMT